MAQDDSPVEFESRRAVIPPQRDQSAPEEQTPPGQGSGRPTFDCRSHALGDADYVNDRLHHLAQTRARAHKWVAAEHFGHMQDVVPHIGIFQLAIVGADAKQEQLWWMLPRR